MGNPQVSVIVPNYNHSKFLEQRLDSIFDQSFQDFEVILLDDRSTDHSVEILNKYALDPRVAHYVINEQNSGSTFKQWDKGISFAKGDFIWIAESDDFCEPFFLEKLLKPFEETDNLALVFSQSYKVNSKGEITGNWESYTENFTENVFQKDFCMEGNDFIENYLIHKNVIPNVSAVLFKKDHLDRISPLTFKPFMKYYADWYFYIQLLCSSRVAFVSESLNYFRCHDKSVIAKAGEDSGWLNIFKMELQGRDEMIKYIERCGPKNLNDIKEKKKIGDKLLLEDHITRGGFLKTFLWVWNKPRLWNHLGSVFFKKLKMFM